MLDGGDRGHSLEEWRKAAQASLDELARQEAEEKRRKAAMMAQCEADILAIKKANSTEPDGVDEDEHAEFLRNLSRSRTLDQEVEAFALEADFGLELSESEVWLSRVKYPVRVAP